MDETRRFLRVVIPGLLFGVEYLVMVALVLPSWTFQQLSSLSKDVSTLLGSILVAGGLGYLFSTIHHWCHWHLRCDRGVIDHSNNIQKLKDLIGHPKVDNNTDRMTALDLTLILWYSRLKAGTPIGDADKKAAALSDIAHSAGTARVASVWAFVAVLVTCATVGKISYAAEALVRYFLMCILGVTFVLLFHDAYRRTGGIAQRLIDTLIEQTLRAERKVK